MKYDFETRPDRIKSNSIKYLRAKKDSLVFTIADSDFLTAPAIEQALQNRINSHDFGYCLSGPEFMESFTGWFKRTYGSELQWEWVLSVGGVVPSLAVAGLVRNGKIIANTPNYGMLLSSPTRAGKEMIEVPLKCSISDEGIEYWEIDFGLLEAAVTPDTEIFYLCNPHNPVGRVFSMDELKELSAFAKKHNLIVVSDEIHCELVYDRKHIPFITVDDYAREHTILLTAPGKTFSIPGIGGAFAVIPNKKLREEFMKVSYAIGHPDIFGVAAITAAYRDCDEWKVELIDYLRGNRDYLESEIKRRFPLATQTHVEGTYLGWVNFGAYVPEGLQEKWIADHANVVLQESAFFHGRDHVRWNFATQRSCIEKALNRLEAAFS